MNIALISTMDASSRRIAHLDMDAFYASVELLRYPELCGLPIVIGGRDEHQPVVQADGTRYFYRLRDYVGRGVITTATYEARALGIHSAMGVMKAAQLAPDTILLPVDFAIYRHYSRLFKIAIMDVVSPIEDSGIDEIYIDLSDFSGELLSLAKRIKQAIKDATGLSCSIGIAPNKLLSKICSDLEKPDGLTILEMSDVPQRIWPLPVHKVNGIGPKAANKLASLGITTIGELAQAELSFLRLYFGRSYSIWLYEASRGIDTRPVITDAEPKSVSRETTFERDLHPRKDRSDLSEAFTTLCIQVAADLKRRGYVGRTVSIKLRFEDFRTLTRDCSLPVYTGDPVLIRRAAGKCLRRVSLQKRIRLLGIKVTTLCSVNAVFSSGAESRQRELPLMF